MMTTNFVVTKNSWANAQACQDGTSVQHELIFEARQNPLFQRIEILGFCDGSLRFVAQALPGQEKAAQAFFRLCPFSEHTNFHPFGVFYARTPNERSRMISCLRTQYTFPAKEMEFVQRLANVQSVYDLDRERLIKTRNTLYVWERLAEVIRVRDISFVLLKTIVQNIDAAKEFDAWVEKHKDRLTGIRGLVLANLGLEYIPEATFKYTPLSELQLWGNKLTSLPNSIGALGNLTTLNISSNCFTELPNCIASLGKLQFLCCQNNLLRSVPEWLAQCTKLDTLYLHDNKLTVMPEFIPNLPKLKVFWCRGNQLDFSSPLYAALQRKGVILQHGTIPTEASYKL